MKKTVIMLIVLFMSAAVTAATMDNIENTEFREFPGEGLFSGHWNSTAKRDLKFPDTVVGQSRAVLNFRAPCDFGNSGQTNWPHPTECDKFVVCAPAGPIEITCGPGTPYWSQSKGYCDRQYTSHGQPPFRGGASCQCGLVNVAKNQVIGRSEGVPTKRIVGGTEVTPTRKYPWQVGLYVGGTFGRFFCGGSIISDKWILTAAHCIVIDFKTNGVVTSCRPIQSIYQVQVWVGEHDQFSTCDDNIRDTKTYTIKSYIPHIWYNCRRNNNQNDNVYGLYDIALLELNNPIDFNNLIRPICLPTNNVNSYAGYTATVSGWGTIKNDRKSTPSSYLREVQLKIRANNNCPRYTSPLTTTKLCAASNALVDTGSCNGDSGGPFSVIQKNRRVLVGVVSYGRGKNQCGVPGLPTIFTRVAHPDILQWINGYVTKSSCP